MRPTRNCNKTCLGITSYNHFAPLEISVGCGPSRNPLGNTEWSWVGVASGDSRNTKVGGALRGQGKSRGGT